MKLNPNFCKSALVDEILQCDHGTSIQFKEGVRCLLQWKTSKKKNNNNVRSGVSLVSTNVTRDIETDAHSYGHPL